MGIDVVLETEDGSPIARVDDPESRLERLLPPYDAAGFKCLIFIDPYGDTVFNHLQALTLIDEINRLDVPSEDKKSKRLLADIAKLARRLANETHTYLKFYGH